MLQEYGALVSDAEDLLKSRRTTIGRIQSDVSRVGNGNKGKKQGSGWCSTFRPFLSSFLPTFILLGPLLLISHSLAHVHNIVACYVILQSENVLSNLFLSEKQKSF